jgi:serine/threonine-protein kinase
MSASAVAARNTLDSLTNALDPENPNETTARAAIAQIGGVIARLGTASDSTWGYIRLAEAHVTLEEIKPACAALRTARRLATSMKQAEVINNYTGVLGCGK